MAIVKFVDFLGSKHTRMLMKVNSSESNALIYEHLNEKVRVCKLQKLRDYIDLHPII